MQLHRNNRKILDNLLRLSASGLKSDLIVASPETAIHDFFRDHSNHFDPLEMAADAARDAIGGRHDDLYGNLKRYLKHAFGIEVEVMDLGEMTDTLRLFDQASGRVLLSAALDQVNRNFQLAHVLALASCSSLLDDLTNDAGISSEVGRARCRVELANYFSAALLMPYDAILKLAEATSYDIDRIAATFGVSFEQACQRLTTLQRKGAQGVPFFFLRIDKAGNVTKRFNATAFTLAEQGGSCPVWNIHSAFAAPGVIVPQFVELPDAGQFFTVSRTTDRPVVSRYNQDRRLVVTLGCERAHVRRIGYATAFNPDDEANLAKIGINCHICTRHNCAQRAHEPLHVDLPVDTNRRGSTRYES